MCIRDSTLTDVLNTGNLAVNGRQQKSAMYSSISNEGYSDFYYDTLLSPVQINNRLAILPSSNPFLLNFLGVRYLETFQDQVPAGYQIVKAAGTEKNTAGKSLPVLAENENVLPVAYTTSSLMSQSQYELSLIHIFLRLCHTSHLNSRYQNRKLNQKFIKRNIRQYKMEPILCQPDDTL